MNFLKTKLLVMLLLKCKNKPDKSVWWFDKNGNLAIGLSLTVDTFMGNQKYIYMNKIK